MRRTAARGALAALAILMFVAAAPSCGATCGDGIVDGNEACDDGAANGADTCCTAGCTLVDTDADGVCDSEDPCPSPGPLFADATLTIGGFTTPASDDTFRLAGTLVPSGAVDPTAHGFAVLLRNQFTGTIGRASIPGGAGWVAGRNGGWSYRDPQGTAGGITRVSVKPVAGTPGKLALVIKGRNGSYARNTEIRPIRVAVALAASQAGEEQCGETVLSLSRCTFNPSARTLRCLAPPAQRRCASADPDARVRCDAQNAAAAQETYYAAHGTYYSGACTGLSGFIPSSGVLCLTIGTPLVYSVVTSGPAATISCVYSAVPESGQPNLICS